MFASNKTGNLNLSFLTSRRDYNRKTNLGLIRDAIMHLTQTDHVEINHRDDLILHGKWKISGSAARLLRKESLHHCTLLVNADIEILNKVLNSDDSRIETAATRSLRVDVKCLSDIGINSPDQLDEPLSQLWCEKYNNGEMVEVEFVDPEEVDFVLERREVLQSWKWLYGNTPRFEMQTPGYTAQVNKGTIETVRLSNGLELASFEGLKLNREELRSLSFDSETEKQAREEIVSLI